MNITHTCARCGEDLELTHDQDVYPDTMAIAVTPCPKCLKDQAERMVEEIKEEARITVGKDDICFLDAVEGCVKIIEKVAGL